MFITLGMVSRVGLLRGTRKDVKDDDGTEGDDEDIRDTAPSCTSSFPEGATAETDSSEVPAHSAHSRLRLLYVGVCTFVCVCVCVCVRVCVCAS
jgi:hypothetical protein